MPFHTASPEEIRAGRVTDVYFARTLEVLKAKGIDRRVRAEFVAKDLPDRWPWGVLAGIEEVVRLLEDRDLNVRAMEEGQVFHALEPVLEVEGSYQAFCVHETAMLGLLCQATGIATRAARCRIAAGPDRRIISFGARRMHPALAPMVERAAYLGGCDGVATIAGAELIGADPVGTMPHALILVMGDTVDAVKAFDEVIDAKLPRVALIDTFQDEKFEALRVADALKGRLSAVRLDTPASRRGDFHAILREVRWELDLRGHTNVQIIVSGGIDEDTIRELRDVVDGFGVGTSISSAPVVDFAMDIVEIEGAPLAKRGKWSGAKQVTRCEACFESTTAPLSAQPPVSCPQCGAAGTLSLLVQPLLERGRLARPLPSVHELRARTLKRLDRQAIDRGEGRP
ncbi:MAG: nicotinate phosphoribosyltransferase [Gemmatimonadetes bacterium]|nr:nicotinate phosphoribosyltransferase [Gemmatimonadota bacterium]